MLGIHSGTQQGFFAKEQAYEACLACAPAGCAHAPEDELGHAGMTIVPICDAGRCTSTVQ
jgi:hypothetical protein